MTGPESGLSGRYVDTGSIEGYSMHRRELLGSATVGLGTLLAGCGGSTVSGDIVSNDTPLDIAFEHAIQGTPSGTRLLVDVTAENTGSEPITPDGEVPKLSCTFLDGAGETLHQSGVQPVESIAVGESVAFQFQLGTHVSEVKRYELVGEWVQE